MKVSKYMALEFCRDAINSCITWKHTCGAEQLILNFRVMYGDAILTNFLQKELLDKKEKLRKTKFY
jgi:hypothetical protein